MTFSKLLGFAIGPFAAAALGLISVPLMAWIFTPEVVGQIAMFNTFLAGTSLILTLGLDQAYVREYHEVDNKNQLLRSVLSLSYSVVILVVLVVIIFNQSLVKLLFSLSDNTLLIAIGIAVAIAVSILYRFLSLVLRMQERGFQYSLLQISAKVTLVICLVLLFLLKGKGSFYIAFTFSCTALVVAAIVAVLLTHKECYLALTSCFNQVITIKAVKFGAPLVVSGFAYWGLISVDRWAIRYYAGLEQLGIYSVAYSFAAVMAIFQQVFSTIWAPIVYRWHQLGTNIKQFLLVTDWVVIILSTVFFMVILASPLLMLFLPKSYQGVVYLLPACMLFPVYYTLSETTVVGMNISRKTNYAIVVTILPLLLNLLLCVLLIPVFSAGGAAIAVAAAFALYLILRTEISKKVWQQFATTKLYFVALLLFSNALWPALTMSSLPWYFTLASLIVALSLYSERLYNLKTIIRAIKN